MLCSQTYVDTKLAGCTSEIEDLVDLQVVLVEFETELAVPVTHRVLHKWLTGLLGIAGLYACEDGIMLIYGSLSLVGVNQWPSTAGNESD